MRKGRQWSTGDRIEKSSVDFELSAEVWPRWLTHTRQNFTVATALRRSTKWLLTPVGGNEMSRIESLSKVDISKRLQASSEVVGFGGGTGEQLRLKLFGCYCWVLVNVAWKKPTAWVNSCGQLHVWGWPNVGDSSACNSVVPPGGSRSARHHSVFDSWNSEL